MFFLNISKNFKILFWMFWRKKYISLDLLPLISLKSCIAFRIAKCKQPRLVKPCLNSDLYFIFTTSGTTLLEAIVSYKPLSQSLPQKWENASPTETGNYLFNVNNRNNKTGCELCLKLTIKTPEQRHWCLSGVFIVNFEHISHLFLVFLLLSLNR